MRLSAALVETVCRMRAAMWGVATKCTIPSNKSSNPLPLSNRTRVDVDICRAFYFLSSTFYFLRRNANCEAASFSVSFCAALRTSFGTHLGNGVTSNLCLPAGVCVSLTAASLCLENRPANLTRAGHSRRWT